MSPPKAACTKGAERHRKWLERVKAAPEKYQAYLQKERGKYRKRKESRGIMCIGELSARSQCRQSKIWRENARRSRQRKKKLQKTVNAIIYPPPTLSGVKKNVEDQEDRQPRGWPPKKDSKHARSYRRITPLENELEEKVRIINRLRKQQYRAKIKRTETSETPRSKTDVFLRRARSLKNPGIKKTLIFHHALLEDIRRMKTINDQRKFVKSVKLHVLRKYRLLNKLRVGSSGLSRKVIYFLTNVEGRGAWVSHLYAYNLNST